MASEFYYVGPSTLGPAISTYPSVQEFAAFDHVAFFHNPGSRQADTTPTVLNTIKALGRSQDFGVSEYQTSPYLEENVGHLTEATANNPNSVITIRAGDGGTSNMLNAVVELGLKNPVHILPGGNANDLAHQLYTWRTFRRAEVALKTGVVRPMRPLRVEAEHSEGVIDTHAFAYWSVGVTASAAAVFNSSEYRSGVASRSAAAIRLAERLVVAKAFLAEKQMTFSTPDGSNKAIEYIVANGSRMAKHLHFRSSLFAEEARVVSASHKLSGIGVLGALLGNLPIGQTLPKDEAVSFAIDPTQRTSMQIDGEAYKLLGSTQVRIVSAADTINMITTRKH